MRLAIRRFMKLGLVLGIHIVISNILGQWVIISPHPRNHMGTWEAWKTLGTRLQTPDVSEHSCPFYFILYLSLCSIQYFLARAVYSFDDKKRQEDGVEPPFSYCELDPAVYTGDVAFFSRALCTLSYSLCRCYLSLVIFHLSSVAAQGWDISIYEEHMYVWRA